jgi:hypothetical protein
MSSRARWRIASASVTGTSHLRVGLPCQDAAIAKLFQQQDGSDVLLTVVSDGAGSAARAEAGSSIACATLARAAEVYFADGGRVEAIDLDVARDWLGKVRTAIAAQARDDAAAFRDYACTLLVAAVGEHTVATMQVGDGAIVVSEGEGWRWAHWPQHGEFANTTFFVTDECAEAQMVFSSSRGRILECAAFSDGIEPLVIRYATRTVFEPFFDQMFPAVRAVEGEGLDDELSAALAGYLSSPVICARTDDDKTLIMATRREEPLATESPRSAAQAGSATE